MNIFFLSYNTRLCALYHVDKHVVKMILETAQILCTALYLTTGEQYEYKPTHTKHPSVLWVTESIENYQWLYRLGIELCKEYTYRYNKIHKTQRVILSLPLEPALPDIPFTPPYLAMPIECKTSDDAVTSYRCYYKHSKSYMFSWKNRPTPYWIN